MKTTWTVALLAVLCAGMLSAQRTSNMAGKPAPDFKADRCLNEPKDGLKTLADCKGEVVLIKLWGVKCGPCLASMPEVQALWTKYEGKGLHVFMLERQGHSEEQIRQVYESRGLTFPQVLEGNFPFNGVGSIPYAYVIGVNGDVIWEGHKGYVGVIDEEIKKVKYLGLGKPEVAKEVEKAAVAFGAGEYAKARDEALKAKEKKADDAAVVADADYIITRVDARAAALRSKIDADKDARRYHDAVAGLETLSGKAFKGMEVATAAETELKELKADKKVKEELKAWDALTKLQDSQKKLADKAAKKRALEEFARKNEGTAAGEEAAALAAKLG
ncbi:MAG: TlpA family protein disulfide reductase [Planctomycetes bacterium]|jgi:thiol-disulfide isomerase/thioredoxin|nr:TlpA family protein disulfide reductase [Planctomycetota bacterium]MCL4728815.1 TlpA family protein disulfide reductase [Planctomycetota bacterium]